MDTPEKCRDLEASASVEGSPLFTFLCNLSPIKPVRSVHSLTLPFPSAVFTSPRISSLTESSLRRHRFSDVTKVERCSINEDGESKREDLGVIDADHSSVTEASREVMCYEVLHASVHENSNTKSSSIFTSCSPSKYVSEYLVNSSEEGIDNVDSPDVNSRLTGKLPQNLQDISLKEMGTSHYNIEAGESNKDATPKPVVQFLDTSCENPQETLREGMDSTGMQQQEVKVEKTSVTLLEEKTDDVAQCIWVNSDADPVDDLYVTDAYMGLQSCIRPDERSMDQKAAGSNLVLLDPQQKTVNEWSNLQSIGPVSCFQHEGHDPAPQFGGSVELSNLNHTPHLGSNTAQQLPASSNLSDKTDVRSICPPKHWIPFSLKGGNLHHRGMLRRCLDFEAAVAHRKNIEGNNTGKPASGPPESESQALTPDNSNLNISESTHSASVLASDDKQLLPSKAELSSQRPSSVTVMPSGIGLHLNSLTSKSESSKMEKVKQETLVPSSWPITTASSAGPFHSMKIGPRFLSTTLPVKQSERELERANKSLAVQDGPQAPGTDLGEEFNQSSPRKRRKRLSSSLDGEGCKRCNCKKSKCLKLYCDCFAAGVYCIESCSCKECLNKPENVDVVLETRQQIESRNPLAFAPKIVKVVEAAPDPGQDEANKTPASARHKRGCNCKKSMCLKKYCECYQARVGCSDGCRCVGCKNTFGVKEGSESLVNRGSEGEVEETESCENDGGDEKLQLVEFSQEERQSLENTPPITPSFPYGGLPPNVHFTQEKHLYSSDSRFLALRKLVGSSHISSNAPLTNPEFCQRHQVVCQKSLQKVPEEDDTPEILRGQGSPERSVKSSSPNQKRVSPPQKQFSPSPCLKSGRKLVLRAISTNVAITSHADFSSKLVQSDAASN
ncbi:hypothetical protein AMTRI_Chr03g148600 [Amborella trichopoda]